MEVKVDQSWAWVVLAAVFGIHFISGSLIYSSGIIRVVLLQNAFTEEKTFITWIISLYTGSFSSAGLLGSLLIQKLGSRKAMFIGSSLEAIGFIGSYVVTDVKLLLLTFGLIAGTGCGICYTTAMVVIGYHFDRYLGLATGIAVSAQGFGTILINVIEVAVNFYGLRNYFLLLAGYVLQHFVFGALLRPSVHERSHSKKVKNVKIITGKDNDVYKSDIFDNDKKSKSDNLTINLTVLENSSNELYRHDIQYDCEQVNGKINNSEPETLSKNIDKPNDQLSVDRNNEISTVEMKMKDNFDSQQIQSLNTREIIVNELPSNKSTEENNLEKPSLVSDYSDKETCLEGYMNILKNFKFILLILFFLFFALAEGIYNILIPEYFIEKGSTEGQVSQMFSFIGIASIPARILTGLILNKNLISLTVLFSAPSFLLAVCSYCVPYFINIYWGQLIYSLLFGVLNFTVYVLINRICIEIVGLQRTTASIGLMMFVWGIAVLLGSPLTEKIVLWTGSRDSVTAVIATFYLMASLVIIPVTYRL